MIVHRGNKQCIKERIFASKIAEPENTTDSEEWLITITNDN